MKSMIDWNEIIPRLPKQKRDDLYLEAITLLSRLDEESTPKEMSKKRRGHIREWGVEGLPDGPLGKPGRMYKILRDSKREPVKGAAAILWKRLKDCQNDTISFEGIMSICAGLRNAHGQPVHGPNMIHYLWGYRYIEVLK